MDNQFKLNTIPEALEDFKAGKFLIVVDDEDRENEGDFIIAAEKITPEAVNFMLINGRGVLCSPITEERCQELELPKQVHDNTSIHGTPFTVTVDKIEGCTTGVSAEDRAATIRALADPASTPQTFGRPGHINPLYARSRGVLRRAGHTEAAVDLARLSGMYPAAALIEIMNEDGTMARMPQLIEVARKFGIKIITIKDLIAYRLNEESLVERKSEANLPTAYGDFRIVIFKQRRRRQARARARTCPLVVCYRRYLRLVPVRLRRTAPQSNGTHRKRGQRSGSIYEPRGKRHRSDKQDKSIRPARQGIGYGRGKSASGFQSRRTRLRRRCLDTTQSGRGQNASDYQQPRKANRAGVIRIGNNRSSTHRNYSQRAQQTVPENQKRENGTYPQ